MTTRKATALAIAVVAALVVVALVVVLTKRGSDDAVAAPATGPSSPAASSPPPSPSGSAPSAPTSAPVTVPLMFDDGSSGLLLASGAPGAPVSLTLRPAVAPADDAEVVVTVSIDGRAPLPFPVTRDGAEWTGTRVVPDGEWVVVVSLTADDGGFTTTVTATAPLKLPE